MHRATLIKMALHTDRDLLALERGDRVRIVKSTSWHQIDGKRERLLGLYAYVTDTESSATTVSIRLEEHREITLRLQGHELALAGGMHQPEVEEAYSAQSASDVHLLERFPRSGPAQYSTYRIGEDEGTATLMHSTMRWELTFAHLGSAEYDGGGADIYDDRPSGAWDAWNRVRSRMP